MNRTQTHSESVAPGGGEPLVSVVVLSYRSADFLPSCLRALGASDYSRMEVLVVDNASPDHSAEVARQTAEELELGVKLLPLARNLGCAGGNNVGWRESRGEFVIFLNPDAEVRPDTIRELVRPMMEDPTIGVTGAKIYWPGTRRIQHAGGRIYPNAMTDHWGKGEEDHGQHDVPRDVDYVTGAGFAVRRCVLERLHGFDEEYFPAYYEETDLCVRARRLGYRVRYIPSAVIDHHESVTLGVTSRSFRRLYHRMRMRFIWKNYSWREIWKAGGFELWWMRHEPRARGYRLEQFVAYAEGAAWVLGKYLHIGGRRR